MQDVLCSGSIVIHVLYWVSLSSAAHHQSVPFAAASDIKARGGGLFAALLRSPPLLGARTSWDFRA